MIRIKIKKCVNFIKTITTGIQMMVCYGCGVKCHAYCYGIDTVTKEENIKGKSDSTVVYFVC